MKRLKMQWVLPSFSPAGLNPKQVQHLWAGTAEEQVSEMQLVSGISQLSL